MKKESSKQQKHILVSAFLLALAVVCLCIGFKGLWKNRQQRLDYQHIAATEYDTVFLSMYPIDTYREEDYAYFRGMTLFKSSYCIPSLSVLKDYMQHIADSGNQVTTAYLGIRPELADSEKLRELLSRYPDITFEIVLPYPSADYWRTLSREDYEQTLAAYCHFLTAAPEIQEANFYFFGAQEWLICNPGNYTGFWSANEEISQMLMAYSDRDHGALLTAESASDYAQALASLTHTLRESPQVYPDLSGQCIIFFGDSVIGNYTGSASIPGVVAGLTGAETYNCAHGGDSATLAPATIDAFFREDLSAFPEDSQPYAGTAAYLENKTVDKQLCFVINYGLNDYFSGIPVSSEDPYDTATYSGALRTAVKLIQENAPGARIILCTPNFSSAFQNGTEPHGTDGFVLEDYVNALLSLAGELDIDVLDNYHSLGITSANEGQYLADQVHPNEACRFLIGSNLAQLFAPNAPSP